MIKLNALKRSVPTILTFVGVAGVVATTILTAKATPKAMVLLKEAEYEKGEKLTKSEVVKSVWRCYIPAAVVGLSTISCIVGANVLNRKYQTSLASAYALLHQSYHKYRTAANSVYGDDADSKILLSVTKDAYVSAEGLLIYDPELDTANEKVLFYDMYSQRYFKSTMANVMNAQYHANRNLSLRGEICVNEFYEFLGLDGIKGGDVIGWSFEEFMDFGILWLDFENVHTTMEDGIECYIISSMVEPEVLDYNDYLNLGTRDSQTIL
ncbi:hypothetical protein AGMMS49975_12390 [Clostridia bacterium]|nr:hypothetical protein AGMMS49975_12390 [Clostridia bacterium]